MFEHRRGEAEAVGDDDRDKLEELIIVPDLPCGLDQVLEDDWTLRMRTKTRDTILTTHSAMCVARLTCGNRRLSGLGRDVTMVCQH